ncbi:S-layer homology domain-containing protein [Paenibacillus gallinarum]|uniref:S-layer homology domain-containing protein n=1 Tax=Paenibacillus gallinarum TaxID=2762232 RepID=A0ABR8T3W2_9BACL|nr:S-layer homology domain-containing protein [Paenibacillus gallinarum]MBD7970392.1 S-layer homology domain-containing protein [Paenibacillus gallinarum]
MKKKLLTTVTALTVSANLISPAVVLGAGIENSTPNQTENNQTPEVEVDNKEVSNEQVEISNEVVDVSKDDTESIDTVEESTYQDLSTLAVGDVIQISTWEELQAIADNPSGNYELTQDINMDNKPWEIIPEFTGTLDGNGFSIENYVGETGIFARLENAEISNLKYVRPIIHSDENKPLGGIAAEAVDSTIKDIVIEDMDISGGGISSLGGLVGLGTNVEISNIRVINSSLSNINLGTGGVLGTGGLVGAGTNVKISDSSVDLSNITTKGVVGVGGLIGESTGNSISNSVATISSFSWLGPSSSIGGAVGRSANDTLVAVVGSVTFDGSVPTGSSMRNVGGLVGNATNIAVSGGSANLGLHSPTLNASYIGGIIGYMEGGSVEGTSSNNDIHVNEVQYVSGGIGNIFRTPAKIKGLTVTGTITAGEVSKLSNRVISIGGAVGSAMTDTVISDTNVKVDFNLHTKSLTAFGGVQGEGGDLRNSKYEGTMTVTGEGMLHSGGLAGRATSVHDSEVNATMNYDGQSITFFGGLVGGGLVGDLLGNDVKFDMNANVTGSVGFLGGLAGTTATNTKVNDNTVKLTMAGSATRESSYIGGLVGSGSFDYRNRSEFTINWTGAFSALGGLIGTGSGGVKDSYTYNTFNANIAGNLTRVGGMAGNSITKLPSKVANIININQTSGTSNMVGGLVSYLSVDSISSAPMAGNSKLFAFEEIYIDNTMHIASGSEVGVLIGNLTNSSQGKTLVFKDTYAPTVFTSENSAIPAQWTGSGTVGLSNVLTTTTGVPGPNLIYSKGIPGVVDNAITQNDITATTSYGGFDGGPWRKLTQLENVDSSRLVWPIAEHPLVEVTVTGNTADISWEDVPNTEYYIVWETGKPERAQTVVDSTVLHVDNLEVGRNYVYNVIAMTKYGTTRNGEVIITPEPPVVDPDPEPTPPVVDPEPTPPVVDPEPEPPVDVEPPTDVEPAPPVDEVEPPAEDATPPVDEVEPTPPVEDTKPPVVDTTPPAVITPGTGQTPAPDKEPEVEEDAEIVVESPVFKDNIPEYAKEAVRELVHDGVIVGYPDNTFQASETVSRVEFAIMIQRAFNFTDGKAEVPVFKDLSRNAWYAGELNKALVNGVTKGFNDNTYRPNLDIPREQASIMLSNVLRRAQLDKDTEELVKFKDFENVIKWAQEDVRLATIHNIIEGYPNGNFLPKAHVTRAEAAVMIHRLMQIVKE